MQCAVIMQCIVDWRSADAMMQHVIVTANGDKNGQRHCCWKNGMNSGMGKAALPRGKKISRQEIPNSVGGRKRSCINVF